MNRNTILFDLDDTLVGNDMSLFLPAYFKALHQFLADIPQGHAVLDALWSAASDLTRNTDTSTTNREKFWADIEAKTGVRMAVMEPHLHRFYAEEFPKLRRVSEFRPIIHPLIKACFKQKYTVVVATNPLFPIAAIEERLRWAGVPADEWPFALVTSYDNMHSTKPNQSYYLEICDVIGRNPTDCIMVGDSWTNDIEPAKALGMQTFWINPQGRKPSNPALVDGMGTLEAFYNQLTA